MILKTPITTNIPTPKAILPINNNEGTLTCLETIKMLGSAHVINVPKTSENKTMMNKLDCLDKELPIYSPTLLKLEDVPIWNNAKPTINTTIPMISKK